jgi:hypothetical protein
MAAVAAVATVVAACTLARLGLYWGVCCKMMTLMKQKMKTNTVD